MAGTLTGTVAGAMFAQTLLDEPAAPPLDAIDPKVMSAIQSAFEDVLNGKKTAEVAAQAAVVQIRPIP